MIVNLFLVIYVYSVDDYDYDYGYSDYISREKKNLMFNTGDVHAPSWYRH